jgi:anaerobic magnesium-protoporphyrin IX monomethyl ester cyclase
MNQESLKFALINCPAWETNPPFDLFELKDLIGSHGHDVKTFDFNLAFRNSSPKLVQQGFWDVSCQNQWNMDYNCGTDIRFNAHSQFNTNPLPIKQWADEVLSFKPDVVGFTTIPTNIAAGLLLARELKNLLPNVYIIFGGPNLTRDQKGDVILKTGIADVVLDGESIETLLEVIDTLSNQGDISSVSGIGYLLNNAPNWTQPSSQADNFISLPFLSITENPLAKPRLALINCPAWGAIPPLGIATLKSFMVSKGYEVKCFDFNLAFYNSSPELVKQDFWGASSYNQWTMDYNCHTDIRFNPGSFFNTTPLPLKEWTDEILKFKPDVVGFSSNITNMTSGLLLARELKNRAPNVPIIFGGPNVAQDREGNIALKTCVPDIIVNREGEETLLEVMQVLQIQGDIRAISGIGYLVKNTPTWSPVRPQISNLDSLPFPDFNDFPLAEYPNPYDIPIMASRGCVYHCVFCYETVFWKKFRMRSGENIVDEMVFRLSEYNRLLETSQNSDNGSNHNERQRDYMGVSVGFINNGETPTFSFLFADSLVNGHFKALEKMCDLIIERGLKIKWMGQATLDKRMTKEMIHKFKMSGCTGLAFGFESGSQKVLDGMSKNYKIENASSILRDFYEGGMPPTINVMVGFPSETFQDFIETAKFLFKNRKWIGQVSNVSETQAALGTPLFETPERFDMTFQADGTWTSPSTGTEKDRKRRLKLLHWAMTLMNIRHQKIGSD